MDPVEGGVTNSYDYPGDPVNKFDLTGETARAVGDWVRPPATSMRHNSVIPISSRAPTMSQPLGPPIPGPTDCSYASAQCNSTDASLNLCFIGCLGLTVSTRDDGKVLVGASVGSGLRADASYTVGEGWGRTAGSSLTGTCSGAFVGGAYGTYEMGFDTQPWATGGGQTHWTGNSWGSGLVIGVGVGCSASLGWSVEWPF